MLLSTTLLPSHQSAISSIGRRSPACGWKDEEEEKRDESKHPARSAHSLLEVCTKISGRIRHKEVTVELSVSLLILKVLIPT
jgi:hypothetical protein